MIDHGYGPSQSPGSGRWIASPRRRPEVGALEFPILGPGRRAFLLLLFFVFFWWRGGSEQEALLDDYLFRSPKAPCCVGHSRH